MSVQELAAKMIEDYEHSRPRQRLHALIYGNKGSGKTSLLRTARKPVLLDMFDSDADQVLLSDKGDRPEWLLPRAFHDGTPASFSRWALSLPGLVKEGVFDSIGTYCLDSLTTWSESLIQYVLEQARKQRANHGPTMEIQDWGTVLDLVRTYIKTILSLPCDVIVTGHIQKDQDQVTGRIGYDVMIQGSSSQRLPIYFSEVYILETQNRVGKDGKPAVDRFLITHNDGMYKASTRLGRLGENGKPIFDLHEPPDIKMLLEKAGLDIDDLPLLGQGKPTAQW